MPRCAGAGGGILLLQMELEVLGGGSSRRWRLRWDTGILVLEMELEVLRGGSSRCCVEVARGAGISVSAVYGQRDIEVLAGGSTCRTAGVPRGGSRPAVGELG